MDCSARFGHLGFELGFAVAVVGQKGSFQTFDEQELNACDQMGGFHREYCF